MKCDRFWATAIVLSIFGKTHSNVTIPPFRQLIDGVQSGPVTILDNKTIVITNLYYNAVGSDANFWVGRGKPSRNGTLVPNELGSNQPLQTYNGDDVKIRLPSNLTVHDIDYLAIWCTKLEKSNGHVYMNERYLRDNYTKMILPLVLPPLDNPRRGLSSGPIKIDLDTSIYVSNFQYTGGDNDVVFRVGRGAPSLNGTVVSNENITKNPSEAIDPVNITIKLPENSTVDNIDYLAFGNKDELFAYVYIHDYLNPDLVGFQLGKLNGATHGLRSGHILLIDEKTFYIPNLHYDGNSTDARFRVGKGNHSGILIPNEKGSNETLPRYQGESIYVQLPGNVTIRDVDYLAIWSETAKITIGNVPIAEATFWVPQSRKYHNITSDEKIIIRVPKCCPINEIVTQESCAFSDEPFKVDADIHLSNRTHLNDVPMTSARIAFVPYVSNINCPKYPLEPGFDNYSLLTNGNLMYLSERREVSLDEYCFDAVKQDGEDMYWHTVFVCAMDYNGPMLMDMIYGVCVFVSAIFFMIICIVNYRLGKYKNLLSKCVLLYAASMCVAFLTLGISQFIGGESSCKYLDWLFHFTIIATFVFLNVYCFEIYYRARYYKEENINDDGKRVRLLFLGAIIPFVCVAASGIANATPGLTYYLDTTCSYLDGHKLPLYLPIALSILISIGILVYAKVIIRNVMKNPDEKVIWTYLEENINNIRLRRYHRNATFIVSLMALCWFLEIAAFYTGKNLVVIDVLIALQGLLACAIFVYPEIQLARRKRYARSQENGGTELTPMRS